MVAYKLNKNAKTELYYSDKKYKELCDAYANSREKLTDFRNKNNKAIYRGTEEIRKILNF